MLHLTEGLFKDTLLRIEEEESPAPGRNPTHDLSITRRALYCFAATTAIHTSLLIFQIQLKSRFLKSSMFKVVNGVTKVLLPPFSKDLANEPIVDVAVKVPGVDYEKMRRGLPTRALPPAGQLQ